MRQKKMFIKIDREKEMNLEGNHTGKSLAILLNITAPDKALAIKVNGKLQDLSTTLKDGDEVEFVSFNDTEGKNIFWHSSAHVLAQAVLRLYPKAKATIGPSIENGFYYDFADLTISDEDFKKIEKEAKKIISENLTPTKIIFKNKEEALEKFTDNPYKIEMINALPKGEEITAYEQGDFCDLCRGPHLSNLGKIKAFKIMKTSGAYWRADNTKEMLTRIYAISYPDKKMLADYLHLLEEAKKRDHKVIGTKLELFSIKEQAPGMPFIHPKGMYIWKNLLNFIDECLEVDDYQEIKTPVLLNKDLWITSGHWDYYRENMYTSIIDEQEFAIKPMNCPGCMLYYQSNVHSYKQLPLRISEIGQVHRHEMSGSLHGLFRVRCFHQDDAHVFMKPEDINSEILKILSLANKLYMTFGLSYKLELSTRPDKKKTIGSDEEWEVATSGLKSALDDWGHPYKINEGDGAFYGPKIDIHVRDALGRFWQCATIQLDMSLPQRFNLEYVDSDGMRKRPVMIHRAIFGSLERFFGVLIEHFAGKFPLWISPRGVRIISVADRHAEYSKKIAEKIKNKKINCDIDDANESVSKKIRNAQMLKINYMITIGDKELENNTISVRTRDNVVHGEMKLDDFIKNIVEEKRSKSLISPFAMEKKGK
jgi:threonyl-tRNA synthetase